MNKVRLSADALADLKAVQSYIGRELKNPTAANRITKKITNSLRILAQFPEAGPSLKKMSSYPTELRYLVCGDYLAFYRVDSEGVTVARVLNGRQDYLRILFGELPDEQRESN